METSFQDAHQPGIALAIVSFIDGDDDALQVLWCHYKVEVLAEARQRLRRARIAPGDFDADDAANAALLRIHRARNRGRLAWVRGPKDFRKRFSIALRRAVRDAKKEASAIRRGGPGSHRLPQTNREGTSSADGGGVGQGFRRVDAELDQLWSASPSGEDSVAATLEFHALHDKLPFAILQNVLRMAHQGYTTSEIASELGLTPRAIERKRAIIRRIYLGDTSSE